MQINGNHDYSRTDYAEWVKEKQDVEKVGKAKEAEKAAQDSGADRMFEAQDEYISSDKSRKEITGLYRIGQDENGNRKIFFDAPNKSDKTNGKEPQKAYEDSSKGGVEGKESKADEINQGKPAEVCVGNTDKVDREIKKLKDKKQELERQIQSASGDEKKIRELEKKLAQVEQELSQKDNDTYRKQHSVFSGV